MKTDQEVKLMRQERLKGKRQDQAAARSGMSVRTLRKYERTGELPSQLRKPHVWRTRSDPFDRDWSGIVCELERDAALQAKTLFGILQEQSPGRYQPGQLRTLQRRISAWRCQQGPEREVMFEQVHEPGEAIQSDFTHMNELRVTVAGIPFLHMLFHAVLSYSNLESIMICFSESFEALAEGLEVRNTDYKPHLTLQYGNRLVGPLNISPVSWLVRDFALVLSHLGQTRYEILRQWNLEDQPI